MKHHEERKFQLSYVPGYAPADAIPGDSSQEPSENVTSQPRESWQMRIYFFKHQGPRQFPTQQKGNGNRAFKQHQKKLEENEQHLQIYCGKKLFFTWNPICIPTLISAEVYRIISSDKQVLNILLCWRTNANE